MKQILSIGFGPTLEGCMHVFSAMVYITLILHLLRDLGISTIHSTSMLCSCCCSVQTGIKVLATSF